MAHDAHKLNLTSVRKAYPGTWGDLVKVAEINAAQIMSDEMPDEYPFEQAREFLKMIRNEVHAGDCGEARSWLRAPITCDACIYDEYMVKAWKHMEKVSIPETETVK